MRIAKIRGHRPVPVYGVSGIGGVMLEGYTFIFACW